MSIIRIKKGVSNYTIMDNVFLRDKALSAKAKGIFAYLLSLPENWQIRKSELQTHFTEGRDSINKGFKELVKKGYIIENKKNGKGGVFSYEYGIVLRPETKDNIDTENQNGISDLNISTGNQSLKTSDWLPDSGLPSTDNQTLLSKDKINKEKVSKENKVKKSNIKKENKFSLAVKEIVTYLNFVCGTKYKETTPKTKSLIEARMKEGFKIQDFKDVVDVMFLEWHKDSKMSKYLRPETLFSTKFEGYLNRSPKHQQEREVFQFPKDAKIQPEKLDQDVLNFLKMNEYQFIDDFQKKSGKSLTSKERGYLSMAFYEIHDAYVYEGETRPLEIVFKEVIGG